MMYKADVLKVIAKCVIRSMFICFQYLMQTIQTNAKRIEKWLNVNIVK